MALIAAAIVLVIVIAVVAVTVRRYPFEVFSFVTRRQLKKAGLARKTLGDLVYWSGGQGTEPLVLVHGTNDQAGTWAQVVPKFVERYRVIIPDLPGHGESAPAAGPLEMPQIKDGLARVIAEETGSTPVTLVGNSMGGWAAMLYAIEHPAKVKQLILEDSGGMTWDLSGIPLVPQTRKQAATAMRAAVGPKGAMPPDYVLDALVRRSATSPMLRLMQGNFTAHMMDNRFDQIKAPVTMIWGDGDGLVPLAYANQMQSRIGNAKLHVIEDCGHIPHRFKPAEFASLLDEAIRV
jgi:pimeloyl-ACP methyl ester carboxylesterase